MRFKRNLAEEKAPAMMNTAGAVIFEGCHLDFEKPRIPAVELEFRTQTDTYATAVVIAGSNVADSVRKVVGKSAVKILGNLE